MIGRTAAGVAPGGRGAEVTADEALALVDRHRLFGTGLGWIDVHLLASAILGRQPLVDRRSHTARGRAEERADRIQSWLPSGPRAVYTAGCSMPPVALL